MPTAGRRCSHEGTARHVRPRPLRRQGRRRQPRAVGGARRARPADDARTATGHLAARAGHPATSCTTCCPRPHRLEVEVFALPNLGGVNVVIHGLLGRGVAASTRFDPQAKGLGEWARSRHDRHPGGAAVISTPLDRRDEREALRATAREFTRREVTPHLQEWEDAGEVPRELHRAAARQGLLGIAFPEEVGGQGGDLLDSVAMQEAMFEEGASSGLMAALFTSGIALPHIAASGDAGPRRPLRPTDPGRRADRQPRHHRAGRWFRRRRDPHHGPPGLDSSTSDRTTSSTAPRPSSPAACAPTS